MRSIALRKRKNTINLIATAVILFLLSGLTLYLYISLTQYKSDC
jgi:hypothetical protein